MRQLGNFRPPHPSFGLPFTKSWIRNLSYKETTSQLAAAAAAAGVYAAVAAV